MPSRRSCRQVPTPSQGCIHFAIKKEPGEKTASPDPTSDAPHSTNAWNQTHGEFGQTKDRARVSSNGCCLCCKFDARTHACPVDVHMYSVSDRCECQRRTCTRSDQVGRGRSATVPNSAGSPPAQNDGPSATQWTGRSSSSRAIVRNASVSSSRPRRSSRLCNRGRVRVKTTGSVPSRRTRGASSRRTRCPLVASQPACSGPACSVAYASDSA